MTQVLLNMQDKIFSSSTKSAQKNIKMDRFLALPVPLPPLDVQRRISDVLDSFDALINDLSSGLPAEIEARRTQYGHYRDTLLAFDIEDE